VSIGQALIESREQAGLTVEQVADATRIRQTLVRAIEHDDYRLCGGDFYARGHIRTIASAVGTDPRPLVAEFDATRSPVPAPRATEIFESETSVRSERRGPNWSAAMAAVLVALVVYGIAQVLTGGGGRGPAADPDPPAISASAPVVSATPSPTDPSAVAQAQGRRVTVDVLASSRSWVQASTASGKELYQGIVEAGEVKSFTDKQRVKLVVGDAGAVLLTVNGTDVGSPGRAGQVARVQFGPRDPVAS